MVPLTGAVVSVLCYSKAQGGPVFNSAVCARPKCNRIIRGPSYICVRGCTTQSSDGDMANLIRFCENCFLQGKALCPYQHQGFRKNYKYSILPDIITPAASRVLCGCKNIPFGARFPIDMNSSHQRSNPTCALLKLSERMNLARAKSLKEPLRFVPKKEKNLLRKLPFSANDAQRVENAHRRQSLSLGHRKDILPDWDDELDTLKTIESGDDSLPEVETALREGTKSKGKKKGTVSFDPNTTKVESSAHHVRSKSEKPSKISTSIAASLKRYPFGNVRMSMMVGPLLIENGAQKE